MRVLRREEKEKKKRKRKEKNNILIWLKNKKLLLFLALSYSAHLSIDVYCNNELKFLDLTPLLRQDFCVCGAKF